LVKGNLKENKIQSKTTARVRLSYQDLGFLRPISTDSETKTEQTESLVAKFGW